MNQLTFKRYPRSAQRFFFSIVCGLLTFATFRAARATEPTLERVLDGYHILETRLSANDFASSHDTAAQMLPEIDAWLDASVPSQPGYPWMKQCESAAMAMSGPSDDVLRPEFSRLSRAIVELIQLDSTQQTKWQLWHCPDAESATIPYAYWAQPQGEAAINPYQGPGQEGCAKPISWKP